MLSKYYLFFSFVALLFCSCQAQSSSSDAVQAPSWETFWTTWKKAIASDDTKAVASMTRFPLVGAEHWGKNGQFNETDFFEKYPNIISPSAKSEIVKMPALHLAKSPMNSEILSKLTGIAMGEELRIHRIKVLQNEGTAKEKKVTISYIFGLVDGAYYLVWLRMG